MNNNKSDENALLAGGRGVFNKTSYITVGTKGWVPMHALLECWGVGHTALVCRPCLQLTLALNATAPLKTMARSRRSGPTTVASNSPVLR
jgi:hypothetical protein